MIKAIITRGQIRPLEPLPTDWHEGQSLLVDRELEQNGSLEAIDSDFAALEQICASNDPANEQMLDLAVLQARSQAKEQVRRQMGLS